MTPPRKVNVFVSYSHVDKPWLERLKVHLKPLEQKGQIVLWSDEKIDPGKKWKEEIEKALKEAVVAVLLISADFLASAFIHSNELPPLLAAAEKENTVILPLIISHSAFSDNESLSGYQSVNSPDAPLKGMTEVGQDAVFYDLYKRISSIVKKRENNTIPLRKTESPQPLPEIENTKDPIKVDAHGRSSQNNGATEKRVVFPDVSVAPDETNSKPQEQMPTGHDKEVKSSSLREKGVKSGTTITKKRTLLWLLPATIIPLSIGVAFLVIFIIPQYLKEDSSTKKTMIQEPLNTTTEATTSSTTLQTTSEEVVVEPPPVVTPVKVTTEPTIAPTAIPQKQEQKKVALRSKPSKGYITDGVVRLMLNEKGFFDARWNKSASGFSNDFVLESEGIVVYDRNTGLRWQQSGSNNYMNNAAAKEYVNQLNRDKFAGYSDWRLPTLEEAMSLMEPTKMNGDLYIDPKFDKNQRWIWTSDSYSASSAWVVYFNYGNCVNVDVNGYNLNYVRAVR